MAKSDRQKVIATLIADYFDYWDKGDIDGLISMYSPSMRYHDIPSGDIVEYDDVREFLERFFDHKVQQRIKLKDSLIIENDAAFIHWKQHFQQKETGREVSISGVELIVFEGGKIRSIREFYEGHGVPTEAMFAAAYGDDVNEKMMKLGLTDPMMKQMVVELTDYFEKKRPYLNPDLTLAIVSEDMGYTRNQISFVINHVLERTFYDLVNSHRVDHAIETMTKPDNKFSVLELGFDAGFNSVSGFYNAFKKKTQMTPAQYLKTL